MDKLVKNKVDEKALAAIKEEGLDFAVGNWYLLKIDSLDQFCVIQITKITGHKKTGYIKLEYREATDWEATEFKDQWKYLDDFKKHYTWIRLEYGLTTFNHHWQEAINVLSGAIKPDFYKDTSSETINDERAMVGRTSKEALIAIEKNLETKRKHADIIRTFLAYEMAKRRQELEEIKDGLELVLQDFQKKIKRIHRAITSIELYLGIDEEIIQIQEGQPAPATTPITFRQQVQYMDEEVGIYKDGGLDFEKINWFDEWLTKKDNYKKICPEEKCCVVIRPRRNKKHYSDDAWIDSAMNEGNFQTYILIRNGDCLFRIYTSKIVIYPRFFPKKDEFEPILKEINKLSEHYADFNKRAYADFNKRAIDNKKDKIENMAYQYRKRALLMQGLIDRSEVFHPLPGPISIMNMEKNPDAVQFIYDDEAALGNGKLPFWEWHKEINKKITQGSRVFITGDYHNRDGSWNSKENIFWQRLYGNKFRNGRNNYPDPPTEGVYTVEDYKIQGFMTMCETQFEIAKKIWEEKKEQYSDVTTNSVAGHYSAGYGSRKDYRWPQLYKAIEKDEKQVKVCGIRHDLTITYNPGGTTRRGWDDLEGHERKNKIRFQLFPHDSFLLNYDQIDLADIDFYLNSRIDRHEYLRMMPILEKIKKQRLKEYEGEKEFIRFIADRNIKKLPKYNEKEIRSMVVESVAWWKYKNKWKRPIAKDDTLALRMIEKRILSKNYEKFEKY